MSTILIKRSTTSNSPNTLYYGELAYSFASNTLFIGNVTNNAVPVSTAGAGSNAAYDQANSAYAAANSANTNALIAYSQANAAYNQANTSGSGAYNQANAAYAQANAAYALANTDQTNAYNAYGQANLAYSAANTAQTYANSLSTSINTTFSTTNTSIGTVYGQANAAYSKANTQGVFANGTVVIANTANLNFNNTASVNVSAVANGTLQSNISFTINTSAISSTPPGGSNTQLQFNNNSVFGGTSNLTFNITSNILTVGANTLTVNATSNTVTANSFIANTTNTVTSIIGISNRTTNTFTTSTNSPIVIDSFASSSYTTVKYIIQAASTAGIHSTEFFAMQDGVSTYTTEYATLVSVAILGTYSLALSGSNLNLTFTPNNPSFNLITIKIVRDLVST